MGECSQKWLDIFITNADPEQEEIYDDQHVCPVQSVRMCHKSESTAYVPGVQATTTTTNGQLLNPSVIEQYVTATTGTYNAEAAFGHLAYWTEPYTVQDDDGDDVTITRAYVPYTASPNGFAGTTFIFPDSVDVDAFGPNGATQPMPSQAGYQIGTYAEGDFLHDRNGNFIPNPLYTAGADLTEHYIYEQLTTSTEGTPGTPASVKHSTGATIVEEETDWILPAFPRDHLSTLIDAFAVDTNGAQGTVGAIIPISSEMVRTLPDGMPDSNGNVTMPQTDSNGDVTSVVFAYTAPQVEDVSAPKDPFADVKVGDLVRIGGPGTHGFTDYLTVVEKSKVDVLYNATTAVVPLMSGIKSYAVDAEDNGTFTDHGGSIAEKATLGVSSSETNEAGESLCDTFSLDGRPLTALRLNHSVNATTIKRNTDENLIFRTDATATVTTAPEANLSQRHLVTTWSGEHLYPLYHLKEWRQSNGELSAVLDHGVKEIQQIKLMGYSLMNKRQVGPQHAHEMIQDDYLILRIKEVHGQVISNNRHANGAFAILYAGAHESNTKGGADVHSSDPVGLVVQSVGSTNKIMRNLTVQVTDRTGQPAHFGRLHLWFKILATHG